MDKQDIPEMNLDYSKKSKIEQPKDLEGSIPEKERKEIEKTKEKLEKIQKFIVKKYNFTEAIGIIPPQAVKIFIEEEELGKEAEDKTHVFVIIPEDQFKNLNKIKTEIIKEIQRMKEDKIWLHIKTPVDIWEYCLDSKFDVASAIAMSYPLFDKGILGALRVAEIHKSLVLRKFERYVVSYVIAGSVVRGEAKKTSDVDVFIVINDTDVKRMPRLELKERLRGIIMQYISEASSLAGVKNLLNVQVYLLTDFWESVKDAHPVIFTFIRDGIPLYDRGTFMPWKTLLKMGRLKPSPEAIDMFMSMGDKTVKRVKDTLVDVVIGDIYWGVLTPSQALLMLYGLPPPTPKQTVPEMEKIFVVKEKMLEKKYITILDKIVSLYKDFEHQKVKEIKGVEIDQLLKDTEDYLKRLKELRSQIEERIKKKTIEQIYEDVFNLLRSILGKGSDKQLMDNFNEKMIKTGKFPGNYIEILKNIEKTKKELGNKKEKLSSHKVEDTRKSASILINSLTEYTQRCDLAVLDKKTMSIKYKSLEAGDKEPNEKTAELITSGKDAFLIQDNQVKQITSKGLEVISNAEFTKAIETQKEHKHSEISQRVFEILKKELGDFEIIL